MQQRLSVRAEDQERIKNLQIRVRNEFLWHRGRFSFRVIYLILRTAGRHSLGWVSAFVVHLSRESRAKWHKEHTDMWNTKQKWSCSTHALCFAMCAGAGACRAAFIIFHTLLLQMSISAVLFHFRNECGRSERTQSCLRYFICEIRGNCFHGISLENVLNVCK